MNIKELYQEIILEHGKNPRNLRKTENFNKAERCLETLFFIKEHMALGR